jgi:hypothetical protein
LFAADQHGGDGLWRQLLTLGLRFLLPQQLWAASSQKVDTRQDERLLLTVHQQSIKSMHGIWCVKTINHKQIICFEGNPKLIAISSPMYKNSCQ